MKLLIIEVSVHVPLKPYFEWTDAKKIKWQVIPIGLHATLKVKKSELIRYGWLR